MAFNLSALQQWKDERKGEIIYKPFEVDQSLNYFDKINGVAGNDVRLPIIDVDPTIQVNASCGFTDTANTTIQQFSITAPQHKVEMGLCLRDLKTYFAKQYLPEKENPDTFEILDQVAGRLIFKTARRMSQIGWLGKPGQTTYPTDFQGQNGILEILTSGIPASQQITLPSGQTITSSNVISVVDSVINAIPSSVLAGGEPVLFVGTDVFRTLILALRQLNLFHYQYDITADPSTFTLKPIVYPGSNVLVVPTLGLNSDNVSGQIINHRQRLIATYKGNFAMGFNVSMDEFDVWYSQDADQVRIRYAYNFGVGVKFKDLVASFHLTP